MMMMMQQENGFPQNTHGLKNLTEVFQETPLYRKAVELRTKFRALHPNLANLPLREQQRLWHEYCGVYCPPVPSLEDVARDASCLTCRDTGWVQRAEHRAGLSDGTVLNYALAPCPNCSHAQEQAAQRMLAASGIPEAKRICNFDAFRPVDGVGKAVDAAYLLGIGKADYCMLLIYGTTGNGKTHMAYAATLKAIERGLRARFWHCGDLAMELRRLMHTEAGADEYLTWLKDVPFLVLDDLGAGQDTDYQLSTIESIINHRYARELATIVTTNKDIKQLSQPVLSRFRDGVIGKIILNSSPDFRPKKAPSEKGE